MASIVIEANGICHKKNKGEKNKVMFSMIMKQDQEAKNVILSGKDACKRSITFSWNAWERNKQKFWVAGSRAFEMRYEWKIRGFKHAENIIQY